MAMSLLVLLDFSFSLEERNVENFQHIAYVTQGNTLCKRVNCSTFDEMIQMSLEFSKRIKS